ncbi:DUF222 domain-containing protein [Microbacterium betulae]|uniref:DUF222 domain-containing protein n=1 Tax=Microbacterium betulae TaxID=2981139 RepID=A0AA97FI68_9MICO|nr:DUF222 domain-containing protein [Microbacterium sp. AB]WOF23500.1 DUF222 domain-containing protein [Microbacterium sp. AB]
MTFFAAMEQRVAGLRAAVGGEMADREMPAAVAGLGDDAVVSVIREASELVRQAEALRIAASGVAASRSTREAGHSGLAQKRGHRSPVSLVQEIMGSTKADATRQVRLGECVIAGADAAEGDDGDREQTDEAAPWHAPLTRALLSGALTSAQHDAILRGLSEPPGDDSAEAWSLAVEQLIGEAAERTVEELARAARAVRDQLDPASAARRFDERFAARSFRMWTDADGVRRASMAFDDHAAAWVQSIIASALRPRKGGPRFVDSAERKRAEELEADPRSNDQLAYDLVVDLLRAGALAEPEAVFGTRQAGVRVVISREALVSHAAGEDAVGITEDEPTALPAWLVAQQACETGITECAVDRVGNPLYLGREQRLFSTRQRIALAIRDGGCRWRGCDRPASYGEAHHIDHYVEHQGLTDVDRGILLCRFHHMQLHHGGWRITREGLGEFVLHPPDGRDPVVLPPRLALRYLWGDVDPPPRRFRVAA